MHIDCPKCQGQMVEKLMGDQQVKVDRCKQCKSIWFDDGELAMLHGYESSAAEFWQRIEQGLVLDYRCPKCPELKLVELPFLDEPLLKEHDVHVDFCIKCHGVWLDAGEIPKVLKLAKANIFKDDFYEMLKIMSQ